MCIRDRAELGLDGAHTGLFGHSRGGHGALTLALRHPGRFASLSALAPIANPTQCPWGHKAFSGYLGEDASAWRAHDASELMRQQAAAPYPAGILVDQGLAAVGHFLRAEALGQGCLLYTSRCV